MSKSPAPKERPAGGVVLLTHLKSVTDLEPRFMIVCMLWYSRPFTYDMFAEEVDRLCGPAYRCHADSSAHCTGSSPDSVLIEGRRVSVQKPRVKRNGKKEVTLRSSEMLQSEELFYFNVMVQRYGGDALRGIYQRDFNMIDKPLLGGRELSKSKVSQAIIKASEASYQELNSRVTYPGIISRPS